MWTIFFLAASAVCIKVQQVFAEKEEWAAYTEKQYQAARLERVEAAKKERTLEVQQKGKEFLIAAKLRKLLDATTGDLSEYVLTIMPCTAKTSIEDCLNNKGKLPEVGDLPWKDGKETLYWAEALRQSLASTPKGKKQKQEAEVFIPQGEPLV